MRPQAGSELGALKSRSGARRLAGIEMELWRLRLAIRKARAESRPELKVRLVDRQGALALRHARARREMAGRTQVA
jgi:hypothetical protein